MGLGPWWMRKAEVFNNHGIAHIYHTGYNHFVSAVQTCAEYVEFSNSIYGKKPSPPTPKVLEQMKLILKFVIKKGDYRFAHILYKNSHLVI